MSTCRDGSRDYGKREHDECGVLTSINDGQRAQGNELNSMEIGGVDEVKRG